MSNQIPDDLYTDLPDDLFVAPKPATPKQQNRLPPPEPHFLDDVMSLIPDSVKSLPGKAVNAWETPLTDYWTDEAGNKMFDPAAAANYYDNPNFQAGNQWRIPQWVPMIGGGTYRSLGAGMLEGAGDVVRGFTSPQNIALTAATAGAARGVQGASTAVKAISAPVAAHGAYKVATGNTAGERAFGVTELAGGLAGMVPHPSAGVKAPGIRNVAPEPVTAPKVDPTAQMLLDFQNRSNEVISKTPAEQAVPQQPKIPESQAIQQEHTQQLNAKRDRLYQLVDKDKAGTLTSSELAEAKQLDAEVRATHPDFQPQQPEQTPQEPQQPEMDLPLQQESQPPNLHEAADHINETTEMALQQAQQEMQQPRQAILTPEDLGNDPVKMAQYQEYLRTGQSMDTMEGMADAESRVRSAEEALHSDVDTAESARIQEGLDRQFGGPLPETLQGAGQKALALTRETPTTHEEATTSTPKGAGSPNNPDLQSAIEEQHYPSTGLTRDFNSEFGPRVKNGIRQPQKEYPGYKGEISNEESVASEATPEDIAKSKTLGERLKGEKGEVVVRNLPPGYKKIVPKRIPNEPEPIQGNLRFGKEEAPEQQGFIRRNLNKQRAILTSYDLSAPGRQGKAFFLNKEWWNSLDDMMKGWSSKQKAEIVHDSIVNHPSGYFRPDQFSTKGAPTSFADRVGLSLPEHEEIFTGKAGKLFGGIVERSSRAHTAFLNKLRSDVFARMMDNAKEAGLIKDEKTQFEMGQKYAEFINNATGRGSLDVGSWKFERAGSAPSDILFAPRNLSGQVRTWGTLIKENAKLLDPRTYGTTDPVLRQQAIRSMLALVGTSVLASELTQAVGAKVSHDYTSSDFLKSKFGNTRIDWGGGYGQLPVAAFKLLSGKSTSTIPDKRTGQLKTTNLYSPGFGQTSATGTAERFFVNRLAPLPSFIWAFGSGRDFDGQPFEVKRALFNRTFPIALNDIIQVAKDNPALAAVIAPTTLLGITGVQNYGGR